MTYMLRSNCTVVCGNSTRNVAHWKEQLLTNQLAVHLARIYQRGFAVDLDALEEVRKEFEQERVTLTRELEEQYVN